MFYQQPKHARLVSVMQILHVTAISVPQCESGLFKGNGILMIFEAELNDSDVKLKIYCKYGNARFEHKSE